MKLKEIIEKLQEIKSGIENAFENELIDFDDLENDISSVIEAVRDLEHSEKSLATINLSVGNYI